MERRGQFLTILLKNRLARSVIAQDLAVVAMEAKGIQIISSSGQNLTESDYPAKVAMRQMAGGFLSIRKIKASE